MTHKELTEEMLDKWLKCEDCRKVLVVWVWKNLVEISWIAIGGKEN